ncbi:MAG: DEAD/DEAH box helicase, partial [Planctomycetes bacterium]|nr:DEAD/DEAH box helicase [Planctomycetota bacterium]
MEYRGFKLDPFQEQAITAIDQDRSLLVAAPTGAGKTLIAEYALEKCIQQNKGIIYTAPLKALSNQKFRDFQKLYGSKIGIVTGDVSINPDAPAVIMTTEIFRNTIFDNSRRLDSVEYVIFDEIHFLDDEDRGTVWEESSIFAPRHIKMIALSATILNLNQLARWINKIRETELVVVEENERPVPLKHSLFMRYFGVGNLKDLRKLVKSGRDGQIQSIRRVRSGDNSEKICFRLPGGGHGGRRWKNHLLDHVQQVNQLPCLYFIFNRRECESRAEENLGRNLLNQTEQEKIVTLFQELAEKYQLNESDRAVNFLKKLTSHGIAFHHAGMHPDLKEIVEQLFTTGLIKLIFTTETFALGINMPARSVVFDTLKKFDGWRETYLKTREYQQMAGRAGRRGIDERGYVYSNLPLPCFSYQSIERIMTGEIEKIHSQFNLSYACILNLYRELKNNIYQACAKSFSNFQNRRPKRKKGHRRPGPNNYFQVVKQVSQKLILLERLGYIKNKNLTEKG